MALTITQGRKRHININMFFFFLVGSGTLLRLSISHKFAIAPLTSPSSRFPTPTLICVCVEGAQLSQVKSRFAQTASQAMEEMITDHSCKQRDVTAHLIRDQNPVAHGGIYPGRNYIPPPSPFSCRKAFFRGGGWGCIF